MRRTWILMAACAITLSAVEAFACTGLLVGKKASVDGSVMISYAADSHTLYGELYRWPHCDLAERGDAGYHRVGHP